MCTTTNTYKLKLSTTSNQFMLLQGDSILCTTSEFIEVTKSLPKYTQVLSYLQTKDGDELKPKTFAEILLNA